MKKKILILTILTALTITLKAADYNYLVFTLTDGTTQSITASNLTFQFADGNLTATSGSQTLTIALTSLAKMEFSNDGTTDIHIVDRSALAIDENADIYDLQGRKVTREQMKRGVYVIKTKNGTHKVNVR